MRACTPILSCLMVWGRAESDLHQSYLPISLEGYRCYQDGIDEAWVHTRLRSVEKDDTQVVDIQVYDDAERPVADLEGLSVRLLPLGKVQQPQASADDLFYRPVWRKSVRRTGNSGEDRAPASWMIFADARGVGCSLGRQTGSCGPSLPPGLAGAMHSPDKVPERGPSTNGSLRIFVDCWRNSRRARRYPAMASFICGDWMPRRSKA